jgi:hypothetical protein
MTKFETLMQQLIDMAASGEISNDEIKNVEYTLMSARRKGLSNTRKNEPGYAEKVASSVSKAAATKDQNKKDFKDLQAKLDAENKEKRRSDQERKISNKLPLTILTYSMGVNGTKKALGKFSKYYSEKSIPGGPGGQDNVNFVLKPEFKDQSFDNAQIVWNISNGKNPDSLNEQFTRMKQLAGLTENIDPIS